MEYYDSEEEISDSDSDSSDEKIEVSVHFDDDVVTRVETRKFCENSRAKRR